MRPSPRAVLIIASAAVASGLLAGCSGKSPSILHPSGPGAARMTGLWWLLFGIAAGVCVVVIGLELIALLGRRGERTKIKSGGTWFVVIAGVAVPAIILTIVYGVGLNDMKALQQPARSAVTVDVIGHQWWWEVRYPGQNVVTANEIHVPVDKVVHLRLQTDDVNHSFWVPQLMPKTDLVAGRINNTWITADRVGSYHGQCAEYCGLQHANMAFQVVAQTQNQYESWLREQADVAPGVAAAASDPLIDRGRQVIETASCGSCHTVRGTSADGTIGPDLTHVGDRTEIGAGAVENNVGNLSGWIADSQTVKPGNKMPPQPLSPEDLHAVVAFLEAGGHR
jgi:cytochrome c oxidase subunit 2